MWVDVKICMWLDFATWLGENRSLDLENNLHDFEFLLNGWCDLVRIEIPKLTFRLLDYALPKIKFHAIQSDETIFIVFIVKKRFVSGTVDGATTHMAEKPRERIEDEILIGLMPGKITESGGSRCV